MEKCAHCRSLDVQMQNHSWQCLICGGLTNFAGEPVKRERVFPAPSPHERIAMQAPGVAYTEADWRASAPSLQPEGAYTAAKTLDEIHEEQELPVADGPVPVPGNTITDPTRVHGQRSAMPDQSEVAG